MLTARQLYFEAVKVGDELPPLVKPPVDRLQIARYVAAAQDWNPLYIDEPLAKNAGFPSALAPGMIAMGFVAELATEWVRGARLRKFGARFVKIIWPGDVLTARGRVIDRRFEEGGKYAIDLELWAENHRGELVVKGAATFQLYYSVEDETRQRQGQAPLAVTKEEEEARFAKLSRAMPQRPAPVSRPLAPPRALAPPPGKQPGPPPLPAQAARPAQPPAVRPAAGKPAPKPAPRAAAPRAAPKAAAKPTAKATPAKAARPAPKKARPAPRPRPAKRSNRAAPASRARARVPAKKPAGKKKRA
jgi:acyl dehydratase